MTNFPGGSDEVIKVTWISEFVDNSKGLVASQTRAREAFDQASKDQIKNHKLMIQSANDAAMAQKKAQDAQKERIRQLRELSLKESQTLRSMTKAQRDADDAADKLAKKEALRQKQTTDVIQKRVDERIKEYDREVGALRNQANEKRDIAKKVLDDDRRDTQARILLNKKEIATKGTSAARKAELREEIAADRQASQIRQRALNETFQKEKRAAAARNKEITRVARAERGGIRRTVKKDDVAQETKREFDNEIAVLKQKLAERQAVLAKFRDQTASLDKLRGEFDAETERKARAGGLRPTPQKIDRSIARGFLEANREGIQFERTVRNLDASISRVKTEMSSAGRVSEDAFKGLENAVNRSKSVGHDFEKVFKDAGIAVRGFGEDKKREIKVLKTNDEIVRRNSSSMGKLRTIFGQVKGGLRLTTNEMILFGRTMNLLAVPVLATAVSVLAQALTTAAGGATALASSLAPLAGQVAGLAPLAFGAAQAFSVWRIAMTNLGQSSLSVGKIIQTSLSASTDQFQTMLKNLPQTAQNFAVQLRYTLFPAFDKLRTELQNKIFPSIFNAINYAKPGFKGFDKVLVGTAGAFGNLIQQVGGRLGSPGFNKDFQTAGQNTNKWIRELTPAVLHLVDAFRQLAVGAAPLVQHFVHLTNAFAKWVDINLTYARDSGSLHKFFMESNKVLDTTLSLIGNLGAALINVGKIANSALGGQMLRDLTGQAKALRAWTSSAKGVATITTYFKQLKAPLYEAGALARDLFKAFFQITNNADFFSLLEKLRTEALPALVQMFKSINQNFAPALINLFTSLLKTIAAVGQSGGLANLVHALTVLSDVIRGIAQSPFAGIFFKVLAAVAIFRTVRFAGAISGLSLLVRNAAQLAKSLGLSAFQAGSLNRALSERGLVGYRSPSYVSGEQIGGGPVVPVTYGGRPVNVAGSAIESLRGGTLMSPSASIPGGFFQTQVSQQLAEQEAAARQQATQRRFFSNRLSVGLGAAGIGLATAGAFIPGKAGTILQTAGTGAAVGAAFGPWGAAIGAATGALGGLVLSTRNAQSALDKLAGAAEKASEQTGNSRARLNEAISDIRGAVLARDEAQKNLSQQQQALRRLERTPGAQGQVEQQKFAVSDAQEVLRQARGRVLHDKELIRTNFPTIQQGAQTFAEIFKKGLGNAQQKLFNAQKQALLEAGASPSPETLHKITASFSKGPFKDWINFLKHIQDTSHDQKVTTMAKNLEKIAESTHKLNTNKQIQIQLKAVFGPSETLRRLEKLANIHIYITEQGVNRALRKYDGGRIPGAPQAADSVPAMLSPGEFVVTGHGERMLEHMTGMPGVLDYVGANQMPHFNTGGRVHRFASGGRAPYSYYGNYYDDALRNALGGNFDDLVSQAIDSATSAMAGADQSSQASSSKAGIPKGTPAKMRHIMLAMIREASGWVGRNVKSAPREGLGVKGRFLQTSDYGTSPTNKARGLDPGAVISDIIRAGYGVKFPDYDPNQLGQALEVGKSKYVTVFLRRGAAQEYDAAIKIGGKGYGFSGGRFTRRDIGGSSSTGGLTWGQFHVPGWPLRKGGRVGYRTGGRVDDRHNLLTQAVQRNDQARLQQQAKRAQSYAAEVHNLVTEAAAAAAAAQQAANAAAATAGKGRDPKDVHVTQITPQVIAAGAPTGGGGGAGDGGAFGLAAQAREQITLTNFANTVKSGSAKYLAGLAKGIQGQLEALGSQLQAAQLAGKAGLANKIQAQIGEIEAKLQIVMAAIGNIIGQLQRRIDISAQRITNIQDKLADRIARLGLDPAGATALKLTQNATNQVVRQDRLQLRLVQKQLADLKAAGAPQDVLDQYIAAVATARNQLRDALTAQIVGRRDILRRKYERRETRASVAEQLAELKLANIATQAQIGGAFDGGQGAQAAYIYSNVIPALQKQIAAVEATLAHAKKLKLTEDEKNQKLIELQQLNNQLAEYQLQAQQDANALLAKTLGKLSFEFNGQSFSDMIGSGVGV